MVENSQSFFYKNISPFIQVTIVLGVILIFDVVVLAVRAGGVNSIKQETPWLIFTSFVLFYALINGILSISAKDPNQYWLRSLIAYAILLTAGYFLSRTFSGMTIDEAGSYRFLLFLFTFCYILILSIAQAMKKIVKIAQKQDKRMRGEE